MSSWAKSQRADYIEANKRYLVTQSNFPWGEECRTERKATSNARQGSTNGFRYPSFAQVLLLYCWGNVTFKHKGVAINRSRSLPHSAYAPFVAFCSTRTSSPKKFDYVTRENNATAILFLLCDSAQDDTLRWRWCEVIINYLPDKSQFINMPRCYNALRIINTLWANALRRWY